MPSRPPAPSSAEGRQEVPCWVSRGSGQAPTAPALSRCCCCRQRNQLRSCSHKAQSPRGDPARRRREDAPRRSPEPGQHPLGLSFHSSPGSPACATLVPGPQPPGDRSPLMGGPGFQILPGGQAQLKCSLLQCCGRQVAGPWHRVGGARGAAQIPTVPRVTLSRCQQGRAGELPPRPVVLRLFKSEAHQCGVPALLPAVFRWCPSHRAESAHRELGSRLPSRVWARACGSEQCHRLPAF